MAALTGAGNVTETGVTSNSTSIVLDVPANVAVGQMLFAAITFQNGDSTRLVVPPAGGEWTQFGSSSPVGARPLQVFGRPITTLSGLPSTYTFTTTVSSGRAAGMMWLDDDVDFTTPDAGYSSWASLSTAPTVPAFTVTETDATIYLVAYTNTGSGNGVPVSTVSGLTKVGVGVAQFGAGSPAASTTASVFTAASSTTSQPSRSPSFTPAPTSTGSAYQFAVKTKGTVSYNASVSLAGAGTLTQAVSPGAAAGLSATGSGTLTRAVTPSFAQAAGLTSAGLLTSGVTPNPSAAIALAGGGILSLPLTVAASSSVGLSGSGTLSADVTTGSGSSVSLSGSGTLTRSQTGMGAAAPLGATGAGSLTLSRTVTLAGSTSLSGEGTLSLTAGSTRTASVALASTGTLTRAVTVTASTAKGTSGSGVLTVGVIGHLTALLETAGTGVLTLDVSAGYNVDLALTGEGDLSPTTSTAGRDVIATAFLGSQRQCSGVLPDKRWEAYS